MEHLSYKNFSFRFHHKNWQETRPNSCHFELTFGCGLHCRHCYSDCYNKRRYIKKELETKVVKRLLDIVHRARILWLCLSGGDPLTRKDFPEIYSYAKRLGFITTIFTNGYSITREIANLLKNNPPFKIEITLNAATKKLYEKISNVNGSFERTVQGIHIMQENSLPLKIKTQVTNDNVAQVACIEKFIKSLGLKFLPQYQLRPRLNLDPAPCRLRIKPQVYASMQENQGYVYGECQLHDTSIKQTDGVVFFDCGVQSGDEIHIDPYGYTFLCNYIREPRFNVLKTDVLHAQDKLLAFARKQSFLTHSKCKGCNLRAICGWCPGKALVETRNMERPVKYYCALTEQLMRLSTSLKNSIRDESRYPI